MSCATAFRRLGVFLRRYPEIRTDVVALIDEWASRFFEELDYVNEGRNATLFAESLRVELPQARLLARQDTQLHADLGTTALLSDGESDARTAKWPCGQPSRKCSDAFEQGDVQHMSGAV